MRQLVQGFNPDGELPSRALAGKLARINEPICKARTGSDIPALCIATRIVIDDALAGAEAEPEVLTQGQLALLRQAGDVVCGKGTTAVVPSAGGNADALPVPEGFTLRYGGCASDGACYPFNFYWQATREAVLVNAEQSAKTRQHEVCHAHQHQTINAGAPTDNGLSAWYATSEGQSFTVAVDGSPFPWGAVSTSTSGLEDMAETCAYWYIDPAHLQAVSPVRYTWAEANLP